MLITLEEILKDKNTVCAFNVYDYEDAAAVISAAEEADRPVILMTNKNAVDFIPMEIFGTLYRKMAEMAKVPVCIHLDHSRSFEDIERAIAAGYTSVMYDGSQLEYEENAANTARVVELAHKAGVSVEAEIGSVGYSDPAIKAKAIYTDPDQAVEFYERTGVDALAVAIGTVHRMTVQEARIDFDLLKRIKSRLDVPIVIHGASGAKDEDIAGMCEYGVSKINFGTALRMAFGNSLRKSFEEDPKVFDRLNLYPKAMEEVRKKAMDKFRLTRIR